ncbi:MAG: hypothetical protein CMJ64_15905 [Planctomycetaceae bacterium]|nr:hypothetical protein [Planctomycetaceae bacterium]
MNRSYIAQVAIVVLGAGLLVAAMLERPDSSQVVPADRREVVFWHFWGGEDRKVVEQVVARFNNSQDRHFVRAIAMPGNNLDMKLFLAVTGGEPPDVINQDDPIMADWAERGALMPLEDIASPKEVARLRDWLVPAARRLGTYKNRMYALCNGLDIRALYYNKSLFDDRGMSAPTTLIELDNISERLTEVDPQGRVQRFGYLPDPRRLWAWGVVFGGEFWDETQDRLRSDDEPIVAALEWMATYRERYDAGQVAAFRQGDQSLPGKTFPLLANRYAMVMDGQWRVRDIIASQQEQRRVGTPVTEYGVCSLPPPDGGRTDAGWVNGNFFLVPRGAKNPEGAWEFMKYWSGFGGNEQAASETCVAGGWIPVSEQVIEQPEFQRFLAEQPLFAEFVRLASSPNQIPTAVIPGAGYFHRTINDAAAKAMYVEQADSPRTLLTGATRNVEAHLDARRSSP